MLNRRHALLAGILLLSACSGCSSNSSTNNNNDIDGGGGGDADVVIDMEAPDSGNSDASEDAGADSGATSGGLPSLEEVLDGELTIRTDDMGVPHLDCATDHDCFVGQGYIHAKNRFFQMDLQRKQARGRLSEMLGFSLALRSDVIWRHLTTSLEGDPLEEAMYERMDQGARDMFEAYTKGVNAYLSDVRAGRNGIESPPEYDLPVFSGYEVTEWEALDSVAMYANIAIHFSHFSIWDIELGYVLANNPDTDPGILSDLILTARTGVDSPVYRTVGPPGLQQLETPQMRKERVKARQVQLEPFAKALSQAAQLPVRRSVWGPIGGASNNWGVSGDLTETGGSLMACDPHTTRQSPNQWFFLSMNSKESGGTLHVTGASIPALPGVVVGHNDEVSWGLTTAVHDLADAYLETLNDEGTAVIRDGVEVPLIQREYEFTGRQGETRTETLEWVPGHGSIFSKDVDGKTAIAERWVGQDPDNEAAFILALMRSSTVDEAKEALDLVEVLDMNWVIGDRDGNLGWYPAGKVPNRETWIQEHDPSLPIPGDGSAEWESFYSLSEMPWVKNPAEGYIATANNDYDGRFGDGNPYNDPGPYLQSRVHYGIRHAAIVEALQNTTTFDANAMVEIQGNTKIYYADIILPEILSTAQGNRRFLTPEALDVLDLLREWGRTCPSGIDASGNLITDPEVVLESAGCSAFHAVVPELVRGVFGDEVEQIDGYSLDDECVYLGKNCGLNDTLVSLMTNPTELVNGDTYFDDSRTPDVEDRDDAVAGALNRGAEWLGSNFQGQWTWGEVHVQHYPHLMFGSLGNDSFDVPSTPMRGGWESIALGNFRRSWTDRPRWEGTASPHMRVVVAADSDRMTGYFQLAGGQSSDPASPNFANMLPRFVANDPAPLHFYRDDVVGAAVETLTFTPTME